MTKFKSGAFLKFLLCINIIIDFFNYNDEELKFPNLQGKKYRKFYSKILAAILLTKLRKNTAYTGFYSNSL